VFFTGPIWLSVLLPIFFATVLLIVSLAIRPTRGVGADRSAFLAAAGVVLAFLAGGALLVVVLGSSATSLVLGFFKNVLAAFYYGTSGAMDAYLMALLLPDVAAALGVSYPEAERILQSARTHLEGTIGHFDDGTGADPYGRLVRGVPGPPDSLADRVWVTVDAALVDIRGARLNRNSRRGHIVIVIRANDSCGHRD
jgi:hypothetical protein